MIRAYPEHAPHIGTFLFTHMDRDVYRRHATMSGRYGIEIAIVRATGHTLHYDVSRLAAIARRSRYDFFPSLMARLQLGGHLT